MSKTKYVKIGCLLFSIIAVCMVCRMLINWLAEPMYPEVPEKSVSNKVVLTSRGCCFWATNATISLQNESENKTILLSEEAVYEYDIFECTNIPKIIEFTSHYSIEEEVSLVVLEFSNTDELLQKGLLFYFGDGDLIVRHGNEEKRFRAGCFGGDDNEPWYQEI